ncbi:MAG TPA: hypothetical protein VF788_09545 [Pseudonocardiaceae bacterium]
MSAGATCPLVEHVEPFQHNLPVELAQDVIHLAAFPLSEPRTNPRHKGPGAAAPQRTVLGRMKRVTSRAASIVVPLIGHAHEVSRR